MFKEVRINRRKVGLKWKNKRQVLWKKRLQFWLRRFESINGRKPGAVELAKGKRELSKKLNRYIKKKWRNEVVQVYAKAYSKRRKKFLAGIRNDYFSMEKPFIRIPLQS